MSGTAFSPRVRAPSRGVCRLASTSAELGAHFAVRRAVFVEEQGLFPGSDRDAIDDDRGTLHVIAECDGRVTGAVRLYRVGDASEWKGDRLAVLSPFRHGLLGAALVRFAVETAGRLGGSRMHAMIQVPNVRFFSALGWEVSGDVEPYHGTPHQPMVIALSAPDR